MMRVDTNADNESCVAVFDEFEYQTGYRPRYETDGSDYAAMRRGDS
jgi:hypothetical protein